MNLPRFECLFSDLMDSCEPFPWQRSLFKQFAEGAIPSCCDLPTGLGKTSVMAIWLTALAHGAPLPRRLVYVVDRRAVVDQATTEAIKLKQFVEADPDLKAALVPTQPLPISTLRGQYLDNREWLADPASPAIIVGTVDMIGSRLLFEGYGVSRKMRPFHAGLLGCDTLVILDEAHLVPPFEKLLQRIAKSDGDLAPQGNERRRLIPSLKLLALSATSRGAEECFGLTDEDLRPGTISHERLTAKKRLSFGEIRENESLAEALARCAWELSAYGQEPRKVIVFSHSRDVALKAHDAVAKLAEGNKRESIQETKIHSQLLVGGRRVLERDDVADWLRNHGLLGVSKFVPDHPVFVFATSAGEVGIDLDADHMVCDLVVWERMIQRLGRVNRRGEGSAKIIVIPEPEPKPSKAAENALKKLAEERDEKESKVVATHEAKLQKARALAKPFELLPKDDEGIDVSPAALRELKLSAEAAPEGVEAVNGTESDGRRPILVAATSDEPLHPALSRPLIDAWSMTSLKEHTGRPYVQPWLRGWVDEDAQTIVIWRSYPPLASGGSRSRRSVTAELANFFEAAPPHLSEMLETETDKVVTWLKNRAESLAKAGDSVTEGQYLPVDHPCAVILDRVGTLRRMPLSISDFLFSSTDKKAARRQEEELFQNLSDGILVVDARIGGLNPTGLLDNSQAKSPRTLDGTSDWLPMVDGKPAIPFRVRKVQAEDENTVADPNWRPRFRCPFDRSIEGEPESFLIVEKWRGEIETADDATAPTEQRLQDHQSLAERKAARLAERLSLPAEYARMLVVAAALHDEGKRPDNWQDAFNAPRDGRPYAKTRGPISQWLLNGYRHEFASIATAAAHGRVKELGDLQDLALHLIAAHHGFARPVISTRGCPDSPPSLLEQRARDVALRFVKLQRQWGPWGLAWWESLLRAADQEASREIPLEPLNAAIPYRG